MICYVGPEDLEVLFDLFLDLCKKPQPAPLLQMAVERLVPAPFRNMQQQPRPKKVNFYFFSLPVY
jgi:hypothetical protein